MNYLAHALLSPPDDMILLGNLCADMVKPADAEALDEKIRVGITLHHEIDRRTDAHRGFKLSRKILNEARIPYAGVVLDILFDHFLALYWNDYSAVSLKDFSARVYGVLAEYSALIPGRFSRMTAYLIRDNWFESYSRPDGFHAALERVSYRTSKPLQILVIDHVIQTRREEFLRGFRILMADLLHEN